MGYQLRVVLENILEKTWGLAVSYTLVMGRRSVAFWKRDFWVLNQTLKLLRANHREAFKWVLDGEMGWGKDIDIGTSVSGEHAVYWLVLSIMGLQLWEIELKKRGTVLLTTLNERLGG